MKAERAKVTSFNYTDYFLRSGEKGSPLFLLLHGYGETGQKMMRRLLPMLPESATILAPNGNFPLPERKEDGSIRLGHAWYFYDFQKNEFFIDYSLPVGILTQLINDLGFEKRDKYVIGYSQGGYLAPFIAENLSHVKRVTGLACKFRTDLLKDNHSYPLDLMIGDADDKVDHDESKILHQQLIDKGNLGEFLSLPGQDHWLDQNFKRLIQEYLAKHL